MSNVQYTHVNNVKRVKQTNDDKYNKRHDGSWFIIAEKDLKKIFKLQTYRSENLNAHRGAALSMVPRLAV